MAKPSNPGSTTRSRPSRARDAASAVRETEAERQDPQGQTGAERWNPEQESSVASVSPSGTQADNGNYSDADVARRAYEIYERRGGSHGRDFDDWLEAERELRGERQER